MPEPFPPITIENESYGGEDRNPGVQLFGRRFFSDQTVAELLAELLLVASSEKRIGEHKISSSDIFPEFSLLESWPANRPLEYAPKARLNLKLFSFLGSSKLETRHEAHREQYRKLINRLLSPEFISLDDTSEKKEVLKTLENLCIGFQGVGGQRTWCAQTFLPFTRSVTHAETLWNDTEARRRGASNWDEITAHFVTYFSVNRHRFLARGGELLYLQLCNALRQKADVIEDWVNESDLSFSEKEKTPELLYDAFQNAINGLLDACPKSLDHLANFIDQGLDPKTAQHTDFNDNGEPRFAKCGWCPTESWQEGLLFAVEFLRIAEAGMDPIEKLSLMEILCAMQVLRSICAQSARYARRNSSGKSGVGPLGYVWVISDPEGENTKVKQVSRRCVTTVQHMIYGAIRNDEILEVIERQKQVNEASGRPWKDPYQGTNGADSRYGHKLFLTLAKRIGLVVPKTGPGARFVLNDRILKLFVMTVIRPGERVTYDSFKKLIFSHYGIAIDDDRIGNACEWAGTGRLTTLGGDVDAWIIEMLEAAGLLMRLSDAHSLVFNPFIRKGN
jgi:hypothetical protein